MNKPVEITTIVDGLLEIRTNIHILMVDAKSNRANGKFFAYKKCYYMLYSMMYPLNSQLDESDKRSI